MFLTYSKGGIGGLILLPGLYKWTTGVSLSSDIFIVGSPTDSMLTRSPASHRNSLSLLRAAWIFQVTGTLTLASGVKMGLAGGALAKNIFWVVTDAVTAGTGSHVEGVILRQTGTTANGRLLAQMLVTLQQVCKSSLSEIPSFPLYRHRLPLLLDSI